MPRAGLGALSFMGGHDSSHGAARGARCAGAGLTAISLSPECRLLPPFDLFCGNRSLKMLRVFGRSVRLLPASANVDI